MVSPRNLRPFIDGTIPAPQQAQRLLMPARQDSTAVFLAKEGDSARVYYPVDSTNEVVAPAQPGIYPQPGSGGIVPVLLGSDGRISQVLPPVSVDLGAAVPVGEAGEKLYGAATATYVDDQLAPARDAIAELTDPETGVVARVDRVQADAERASEDAGKAITIASKAVVASVVEYALGTSETAAPTSGWSTESPNRTPGTFIWMRTVITYGNGADETTSPVLVTGNAGADGAPGTPGQPGEKGDPGQPGATGPQGVSVASVTTYFRNAASKPAVPTAATPSGWSTTEPAYVAGQKLWRCEKVTYSNSTFSYTPVSEVAAYTVAANLQATIDAGLMRAAKKSSPPAVKKGLIWAVLDDETGQKLIGLRVPNSNASAWVPYQILVEDLMVVGENGTIRFRDGVVDADNIVAGESLSAKIGYFAQAFFDEAAARNFKVTNELIAERLLGKHFIGSLVEGGEILMQGEDPGKDKTGTYTSFTAQADVNLMQNGILGDRSGISWVTGGKNGSCVQSVNKAVAGKATAEISTYILSPLTEWNLGSVPYDGVTTVKFYVKVPVADTVEAMVMFVNENGAEAIVRKTVELAANTWTEITISGPSGYRPGRPPNIGAVFPVLRVVGKPQAGKATATILLDEITWVNIPNTSSSIRLYKDAQGTPSLEVLDFQGTPRITINAPSSKAPKIELSSLLSSLKITLDENNIPVLYMDGPGGKEATRLGVRGAGNWYGLTFFNENTGAVSSSLMNGYLSVNHASAPVAADAGVWVTDMPQSTSGAWVRVGANGRLYRDGSVRRLKYDIGELEDDPWALLDVPIVEWCDNEQTEQSWRYRQQQAQIRSGVKIADDDLIPNPGHVERIVGVIAENIEATGKLARLLVRDADGKLIGVQYEKIGVYLIPIVRDHEERITELEAENQQLKTQLASIMERLDRLER